VAQSHYPYVTKARARLGGERRTKPPTHPDVLRAQSDLAEANARAALDKRVDEIVAAWPKLSDEQVDRVAALLRVGKRSR
jgi:hypothetical protein